MGVHWLKCHEKAAAEMGLTAEDLNQLSELEYNQRKSMIPLQADERLARLEVKYLLEQDHPDQAAVNQAIERAGQAGIAVEKQRIAYMLKVKELLGAEKYERLQQARQRYSRRKRDQRQERKMHARGGKSPQGRPGKGRGPGRQPRCFESSFHAGDMDFDEREADMNTPSPEFVPPE
jgi:Spy/CpxP family protein refolding chaperone